MDIASPESSVPLLVLFESRHGQSEKIAAHITVLAARHGIDARARNIDYATPPGDDRAIIVVAPVYFGRHSRRLRRYLRHWADCLASVPTAFVSVSNSAAAPGAAERAEARAVARRFVSEVSLHAAPVVIAGGALAYPRYPFFLRWVMRRIAAKAGAPVDTSRSHELTDWSALDDALASFLEQFARPKQRTATVNTGSVPVTAAAPARSTSRISSVAAPLHRESSR